MSRFSLYPVALAIPVFALASIATSPNPPLAQQAILATPPAEALLLLRQEESLVPKPPVVPKFDGPSGVLTFSPSPTDREIILARLFEMSLVPAEGTPIVGENSDLARSLVAFRSDMQDISPLTAFLDRYPSSRWKASLLTNIGLFYFQHGYWSKTMPAWKEAWELSKNSTEPRMKAIADRSLGELSLMYARLGRVDSLKAIRLEAQGRDIRGPGFERFDDSMMGLNTMEARPEVAYFCGPIAVGRIYQTLYPGKRVPDAVDKIKSTDQGTDMETLLRVAKGIGLDYQVAFRSPGAEVIVPSIVNWKVGHFAALTKKAQGSYLSEDRTFGVDSIVSKEVLDDEASGYFLVKSGPLPAGWRSVDEAEASNVYGKGSTGPNGPPAPHGVGPSSGGGGCSGGMAQYSFDTGSVSLMMTDTPVGYQPPVGQAIQFTIDYNQREGADTSNISNLGANWCFNWLAYIQAPSSAATVSYGPGGGQLPYANFNSSNGTFALQELTEDTLVMTSAGNYEMDHPDGSKDIYSLSETTSNPRIFRTKSIDRFGNTVTYAYDSYFRLQTVTDAINQVTVISYGASSDPTNPAFYNITQVMDPFGRAATFTYNGAGQLASSRDVLGITSSYSYGFIDSAGQSESGTPGTGTDAASPAPGSTNFITSLTTPYGTTNFAATNGFTGNVGAGSTENLRTLIATDPLGGQEKLLWADQGPLADSETVAPAGFTNEFLSYRNAYFWDKKAMQDYPNDYTKARVTHFLHDSSNTQNMSYVIESTKEPYENRVWRAYAGQTATYIEGPTNQPTKLARILDDGTEQDFTYQYDGAGNVTQKIDPVGREVDYAYAANQIDVLQVSVKNGTGFDINSTATYNSQHLPLTVTDASGQTTTYTYNGAGQVLTATDALNEKTTYSYDGNGYLQNITGPVAGATTSFTYDLFGRVQTVTDSEGYTVTTLYDPADRPIQVTYPDSTTELTLYNQLDAEWTSDRLGRWTRKIHDALQHLVILQDPLLRRTSYDWCTCGNMVGLIDPAGNRTAWVRDAQSRLTQKIFPDGTSTSYIYEGTTSRLKLTTDAVGQITQYTYYPDNSIKQVFYDSATISTPSVNYTYDPAYMRITSMVDGIGTSTYSYNPITSTPTLGAGRLASVAGPIAGVTVSYGYDQLGRVTTNAINGGSNTTTTVYDALGRVSSMANPLGQFSYSYVDATNRISHLNYPNGQVTNYSYYPNSAATPGNDDQRLQQIVNLGVGGANQSTFQYSYDAVGRITSWEKQNDASTGSTTNYTYDSADQLIAAVTPSGNGSTNSFYGYDPLGNRLRSQTGSTISSSSFNNVNQLSSQGPGSSMTFAGTVSKPVTLSVGGNPATVDSLGNWLGSASVTIGANTIPVSATDANSNTVTKTIDVSVSGVASRSLAYDPNGNLTNNGAGQAYQWDAANRLVGIVQTTGTTGFVYDGAGRRTQETLNGTVIKQWVWCGSQPCEELNSAEAVTKMFFAQGEQIGGSKYFYTRDHLGSIREMTDGGGVIHARYDYDPYGNVTKVQGDLDADFGFTGDYYHKVTGLNLTLFRAYDPMTARWLSRDPIGEKGGLNLYEYVGDDPSELSDLLGLCCNGLIADDAGECCKASDMKTVVLHDWTGGGIPHTFLETPDGSFGFYPAFRDTPYGPGQVNNDASHPRDKQSKTYTACPKTLKALYDSINSHKSGWYTFDNDFPGQNCTGWACARLSDAGFKPPANPHQPQLYPYETKNRMGP